MLKGLLRTERRTNGGTEHGANGHGTNGHGANGHGSNGHGAPAPHSAIEVSDGFLWSLEVRQDQQLLGAMHSSNPFVLITFFREYAVLYGEPVESYAVWLRHRGSDRGAPLSPLNGEVAWLEFLRRLDPELDDHLHEMRSAIDRTSMIDPSGRQTHPDAVLEVAFGQD
jgi:hypothetical protein